MKEGLESVSPEDVKFSARLLLVEDSPISEIVAKEAFTFWGLDVDFVNNGQDAVERVSRVHYDLVFMDCQMPVMDGYTATTKIREMEAQKQIGKTPIIALTGHSSLKERMQILECGMDGYIAKPFQMEGLFACLKQWLGDRMSFRIPPTDKEENETDRTVLDEEVLDQLRQIEAKGSSGLIEKLFKTYISSSEGLIQEMSEGITSGDFERIAEKSHALKSSSHHVGAVELSRLFRQLEAAAKKQKSEEVNPLFLQVQQEYDRVLEKIQEKLKTYGG